MKFALLLSILLTASLPTAHAQGCVQLTCSGDDCSIKPEGLTANLPAGFKVKSIGANTRIPLDPDAVGQYCRPANRLPNPVSLDQAIFSGQVEIVGKLKTSGTLRFEPNDGGELTFKPTEGTFNGTGTFFKYHFSGIKLDGVRPRVAPTVPQSLSRANCWQAKATAELSDFEVIVRDSSAEGTYALHGRITNVHAFTKCTWGSE